MSIFNADYQNYVNENFESETELYCICGHKDEDHYNDGGDSTAKYGCEADNGRDDGLPCYCDDFQWAPNLLILRESK